MNKPTTTINLRNVMLPTILAALASTAAALPAAADTAVPAVTVSYADLDTTRAAGVNELYGRIRMAAHKVCAPLAGRDLKSVGRWNGCVDQAVSQAVATINQPALAALHAEKTGKTQHDTLALLTSR